jgi:hypothetical protein
MEGNMSLTERELWTALHGMIFGAIFLLAFSGGLAGLYSLRPEWVTASGIAERMRRLKVGLWAMAVVVWATVYTGTFIVYPWYRATPPEGATDLSLYPRSLLRSDPATAAWHTFGMEWKEHVAWIAPLAATAIAFTVTYYGPKLAEMPRLRRALMVMFFLAFVVAGIAGVLGALITKAAPVL